MSGLLYFKLCLLLIASSTIGVHGNGDSMFGKHVGGEVCEKDDKDCKDKVCSSQLCTGRKKNVH